MAFLPVPQHRLDQYKELLGLDNGQGGVLAQWSSVFLPRTEPFVDSIENFVNSKPQLRIVHENQPPGKLRNNWRNWYTLLFATGAGEKFVDHVWRSGQAHVAHNLDHRFISMAYDTARRFLQDAAMAVLPLEDQAKVITYIDRAVDFSLLVETDSYVVYATQCELEVIQGISHQVRNPVSVIGGSVRKLLKLHPDDDVIREIAETILSEAVRLERMAKNVNEYVDITQHKAVFNRVDLPTILECARDKVRNAFPLPASAFKAYIAPEASRLNGDPMELCVLFGCLLENAFRYADPVAPNISVTSVPSASRDGWALITIINNGISFDQATIGQAFSPFHSSQTGSTGFGLPMARVIASKYYGNITLAPLDGSGTRCVVTLPLHPNND